MKLLSSLKEQKAPFLFLKRKEINMTKIKMLENDLIKVQQNIQKLKEREQSLLERIDIEKSKEVRKLLKDNNLDIHDLK